MLKKNKDKFKIISKEKKIIKKENFKFYKTD